METNTQIQAFLLICGVFIILGKVVYYSCMGCNDRRGAMQNNNMKFCRSCSPLTRRVHRWFCIFLALVLWRLAFVSYSAVFHDFWPLIGSSHWKASPPNPVVLHPSTYPAHFSVMFYSVPPYIFFQGSSSPRTGLRSHPFLCCWLWGSLCSLFLCYTALLTFVYQTFPQGSLLYKRNAWLCIQTQGKIRKIQTDETCVK